MTAFTKKSKKNLTLDDLGKKIDKGQEDLAVMIAKGFANTASKEDLRAVEQSIRGDIAKHDARLQVVETKLDRALYTELVHLETRLKRVEEKVGIKPSA